MTEERRINTFGCDTCWPEVAAAAWAARDTLAERARLLDESHEIIRLLQCPACQQHFVSVFREWVDWVDGDDPQFWKLTPLTEAEMTTLRAAEASMLIPLLHQLLKDRRCLQLDAPKGEPERLAWGVGAWIVG